MNRGFWNNRTEALPILNPLIALNSSSREALAQLGTIEPFKAPGDVEVATAFLRAAAKHIPAGTADESTAAALINPVADVRFVVLSIVSVFVYSYCTWFTGMHV